MIRQTPHAISRRQRRSFAPAVAASLAIVSAGCASLPGSLIPSTGSTPTIGDGRERGAAVERYAFARARIPVTIVGQSTPRKATAKSPAGHYTLQIVLETGAPKYSVDTTVATRVARKDSDSFKLEIDDQRLLRSVATTPPPQISAPGISDLTAELARSHPASPARQTVTRVSATRLTDFRHEAEIDPAVPAEVSALQAELDRLAKAWGLAVTFVATPVEGELAGRRFALAPVRAVHCNEPVCFRIPIPYRLALTPGGTGWRGKLETHVWLANEGPVGGIDVRYPGFAQSGTAATFENGMLQSLKSNDAAFINAILRVPVASHTASIGR